MKHKNSSLSAIRFLAMMFVVFCHLFEQAGYTVIGNYLAVGVQLFLLLSGYLYSQKEFHSSAERVHFVLRNFAKILLNYYICVILFFIPVYSIMDPSYITLGNLCQILLCKSAWWGIHHLWYIPYCLLCYLITPLLYDVKKFLSEKKRRVFGIVLLLLLIEVILKVYGSYFLPYHIICYCIGYFLPTAFSKKKMLRSWVVVSAVAIPLNIVRYGYRYVMNTEGFSTLQTIGMEFLYSYACVFLALSIFLGILVFTKDIIWPKWLQAFWSRMDPLCYSIYLVHMIFIKGCLSIIGKFGSFMLESAVIVIISFLFGYLLMRVGGLLQKPLDKLLAKL